MCIFNFFRIFGFIPYKIEKSNKSRKIKLHKYYAGGVIVFLTVYWIGLIRHFFQNDQTSDKLTSISNWIQLLINGWTLNIIMLFPLTLTSVMNEIFKSFERFDSRAVMMSMEISKTRANSIVLFTMIYLVAYLLYMAAYEIYVVLIHHQLTNFVYWLITFIPTVVSLAALCFSYCMLVLIFFCVTTTKNVLMSEAPATQKTSKIISMKSAVIEQSIRTSMPSIFHLYQEILDLRLALEKFLGPIFLSTFTSIFVITTSQIYHCYTLIESKKDPNSGYSSWNTVLCINIIFVNISATIALTTICEMISNQVRKEPVIYE